jgi:hypothetical protein
MRLSFMASNNSLFSRFRDKSNVLGKILECILNEKKRLAKSYLKLDYRKESNIDLNFSNMLNCA